jgi:hypothetical protein
VVHPVVFYNHIISTEGSVKHNTNIVLKYTLGVATNYVSSNKPIISQGSLFGDQRLVLAPRVIIDADR